MIHSPITEAYEFMTMLLAGFSAELLYELFGYVKSVFTGKITLVITDTLFVISTGAILFLTLQYACGGNIRFYQIAGFMLGYYIFNRVFARVFKRGIKTAGAFAARVYDKLQSLPLIRKIFK